MQVRVGCAQSPPLGRQRRHDVKDGLSGTGIPNVEKTF